MNRSPATSTPLPPRRRGFVALLASLLTAGFLLAGAAFAQVADEGPLELERLAVVHVGVPGAPAAAGARARATILMPLGAETTPPVVMLPGLGLEATIWLTAPDGREGWAQRFARAGFPVWAVDPPASVVSGIDAAAFAGEAPPRLFSWNPDEVWARWGLGPEPYLPYENVRFPVEAFDVFLGSLTPVVLGADGSDGAGSGEGRGDGATTELPAALVALLERTGPAVVVAHSAAGETAFALAAANPEMVRALVVVEPVGCPTTPEAVAALGGVPFFWLFGDYVELRNQRERLDACRTTAELTRAAGGIAAGIYLPDEEIFGNTHLLMVDDNSAVIAARVIAWLNDTLE